METMKKKVFPKNEKKDKKMKKKMKKRWKKYINIFFFLKQYISVWLVIEHFLFLGNK